MTPDPVINWTSPGRLFPCFPPNVPPHLHLSQSSHVLSQSLSPRSSPLQSAPQSSRPGPETSHGRCCWQSPGARPIVSAGYRPPGPASASEVASPPDAFSPTNT